MARLLLVALILLSGSLPSLVSAAPSLSGPDPVGEAERVARRPRGLVYLEGSAVMRLRADLFVNPDLGGGGALLFRTPADAGKALARPEEMVHSANLRLRFSPRLHIADTFVLHLTGDLLRNTVLGSTPAFSPEAVDPALVMDAGAQASPEAGRNASLDAVVITRLYGEWTPLARVWVRLGRMPTHFGLGLAENSGDCLDCDYESIYDGVEVRTDALGMGIRVAWRWPGEGPTSEMGRPQIGQPVDGSQLDDVGEWMFELSTGFFSPEEERARLAEAVKNRGWILDWAVRFRRRTAQLQSDRFPLEGACAGGGAAPGSETSFDCFPLVPRDMDIWYPGAFLRFRGWPSEDLRVDLAMEFQSSFGDIGTTQAFSDPSTGRGVRSYATAFRGLVAYRRWSFRLDGGVASGDSEGSFLGVRDGSNTIALRDEDYFVDPARFEHNRTFEQFVAHRSFFVDRLLFREIVGAVTNAGWFRPSVGYGWGEGPHLLDLELGAIAAWALAPQATPGRRPYYGVEADVDLKYRFGDHVEVRLGSALLLPGEALAAGELAPAPDPVFTTQLDLFFKY